MSVNPQLTPTSDQMRAWGYYGIPRGASRSIGTKAPAQAVGEVRYVVGWAADQMVRMGWRVTIDDSETWTLTLPSGEQVVSDAEEDDSEQPEHPANASRRLLEAVGWRDSIVRQVTTNLFVAGELYYVNEDDEWRVVSMISPDLSKRVSAATMHIHGLWPHPADDESPDAPLFGVLAVLDDLLWLTRLERSQSANRVAMRGIIGISDQLHIAGGNDSAETFWDDFQAALSRPMDDPEDVSPVGLRGPADLVEPVGKGMKGLSWLIPEFPYDERIDERMQKLIQRLAYGLPIPPEILLGLQAQSRATAFQVEGNAYRAHIEPMAWTVAEVPQDALKALLPEVGKVRIIPDPTAILARRHTIEDVFEAFDRGAVGFDYLREALGIPARAEVNSEDVTVRQKWNANRGAVAVESVPDEIENVDDDPAVNAAVALPAGELDAAPASEGSLGDAELAEWLARIDDRLLGELTGAAEQAVVKARERMGAALRSNPQMRNQTPADMPNDEVALHLGRQALIDLGVDVDTMVASALAATLRWWERRVVVARDQVSSALLSQFGVEAGFDPSLLGESVALLDRTLTAGVFDTLDVQALREVASLPGS